MFLAIFPEEEEILDYLARGPIIPVPMVCYLGQQKKPLALNSVLAGFSVGCRGSKGIYTVTPV